ncbi:hypothetical protein GGX14DRAFT_405935 [Mycena pura]|uniref:Uncharacterized protein n=1 Tax=Mycena pura TaxID=153505 RepID=A0AAD6UUW0_9AGAR|nr:hypothetical protein GGX14DRAFT_405935 [Mycena pura]
MSLLEPRPGAIEGASSIDMIRRSDIHGSSSILDQENYLSHGSRKTGARRNISIFKNTAAVSTRKTSARRKATTEKGGGRHVRLHKPFSRTKMVTVRHKHFKTSFGL